MQSNDLAPNPTSMDPNPNPDDLPTMHDAVSVPIHRSEQPNGGLEENGDAQMGGESNGNGGTRKSGGKSSKKEKYGESMFVRRERPSRACTARTVKLYVEPPVIERKARPAKREKAMEVVEEEEEEVGEEEEGRDHQYSSGRVVTQLVNPPTSPGQFARWNLRSMWELASVLNFLNIFRPLLKITAEFSVEELETALITPNNTLGDVHIPLLKLEFYAQYLVPMGGIGLMSWKQQREGSLLGVMKSGRNQAIPPVIRMACGSDTWVTVLCRKLRDWWHWVADGDLPIVASHGMEIEVYKSLDPGIRVVILKALCDIRVEQEDIRNYIDDSIKHGAYLSAFRKDRIGGDSHGISYWFEDDPIIGHRLYREMRKTETKRVKMKGSQVLPSRSYKWETVATSLDEFQDVSEKLFSSRNRTEASLGKKLKNNMLPEIEKIVKRKEKLIKKQQREALLLDNLVNMDGLAAGRFLRDRKPVTYTFDDFDRSINEAIKVTKKKHSSPEPSSRRETAGRSEHGVNGMWSEDSRAPRIAFSTPSPEYDQMDEDDASYQLDRSNRRRQRPQRYSEREFVEATSENDADFDSDDDIVGEAVYDDEYLRQRKKKRKPSSGSEGDEEYQYSDENMEEEEEEALSMSEDEDSDRPRRGLKTMPDRTRRGTKLRSVDELQAGLRRSKRSNRNRINYQQYELSESEPEGTKREKASVSDGHSDVSENEDDYMENRDSEDDGDGEDGEDAISQEEEDERPTESHPIKNEQSHSTTHLNSPGHNISGSSGGKHFLDLNEAAPGSGFDDGPGVSTKSEDKGDF
ncbi:DDT domain-containing protein [Drosera capensis]